MKKELPDGKKFNFKNLILGGQDGIVNVLGLVLGVASATSSSTIVIISGIVATVAESVSMMAVAYTSSRAAKEYDYSILEQEKKHVKYKPKKEMQDIKNLYYHKGFRSGLLSQIVKKITSNKKIWAETLVEEEHKVTLEEYKNPIKVGLIVGLATLVGSLVPLIPFFFLNVKSGIIGSLIFSGLILFLVGALKAKLSIGNWKKSGAELMIIGIISALIGYGVGVLLKVSGVAW